jgi:hypothetical protein
VLLAATGGAYRLLYRHYESELHDYLAYFPSAPLPLGKVLTAIPIAKGHRISIVLHPEQDMLAGVKIRFVTWKNSQAAYDCDWELFERQSQGLVSVRRGVFPSRDIRDWGYRMLTFDPIPDSRGRVFEFVLSSSADRSSGHVGIPLFETETKNLSRIESVSLTGIRPEWIE